MSGLLFRRTANGDLYPIHLAAILQDGQRVYDPSYSLSMDPEIWEKVQQDAVTSGAVERSLLATAGTDWGLLPYSDRPEDKALAEILEEIIKRTPRFFESRRNLAEARFLGTAFARLQGTWRRERIWDGQRRDWWIPGRMVDIDRRRIRAFAERDKETNAYRFRWELHSPARKDWEPWEPKKVPLVRHLYADNESRLGFGRGIMDSIYFAYYTRTVILKDGLQGLKRWAQGLLVGKVDIDAFGAPDQTNEDIRDAIKTTLLEMLGDNVLVIGKNDEVQVVTGGMEGHQIVSALLDRIERELVTRIEGTPVSVMDGEGGGAYALSKTQERREDFQRRFDRESLGETLTNDFVKFVYDINRPTLKAIDPRLAEAGLPHFDIRDRTEDDAQIVVGNVGSLLQAGIPLSKSEVYERTGWRQPEDDEETFGGQMDMMGQMPGQGPPGGQEGPPEEEQDQGPPQEQQQPQDQQMALAAVAASVAKAVAEALRPPPPAPPAKAPPAAPEAPEPKGPPSIVGVVMEQAGVEEEIARAALGLVEMDDLDEDHREGLLEPALGLARSINPEAPIEDAVERWRSHHVAPVAAARASATSEYAEGWNGEHWVTRSGWEE